MPEVNAIYEFRDDYASDAFATVTFLDDALFDGIVMHVRRILAQLI